MRPGRSVLPRSSITCVLFGNFARLSGPTEAIRAPSSTTVVRSCQPPLPSITRTLRMATGMRKAALSLEGGQDLIDMTIHFDFAKYSCHLAALVDDEGAALNAPVRPSIHASLLVDALG